MLADEDGRVELPEQFRGAAADTVVVHLHRLDDPIGIHDERPAQGHALVLEMHAEQTRELRGRVRGHP